MSKYFLGVDTSNYTTSLSLVKDGKISADIRRVLPVEQGKKGLRQSDAVFLHTKALPCLSKELFTKIPEAANNISAVGVSVRPRDAQGSYMPCFLSGLNYATAVSDALNIPLYEFSHQSGHIQSAVYSSGADEGFFEKGKFLSFHVSGGTTEALITEFDNFNYSCQIIGGTNDASCGQIIDRFGVLLGLEFPCGKALDELSRSSTKALPKCVNCKDGYFSMSGLENKVQKFLSDGEKPCDVAHFLFISIAEALKKSTLQLREKYGNLPVLYAGGVMSNTIIRQELSKIDNTYFAQVSLSSDNACGIALLTSKKLSGKVKI